MLKPKKVVISTLTLIVALLIIYALSDSYTPSSSRGVVSANVVELAPRVTGNIIEIHVPDNAVVSPGDALFSIDPYPYELARRKAEANLNVALQNVDSSSAAIVAAQAAVTQARILSDQARAELQRAERLEDMNLIPQADADNARTKAADATARLSTAEANLASAKAALGPVGVNNPQIEAAAAQLAAAQYDLASTTVTAPHRGVVTNLNLAPGLYVGAGQPTLTFIDAEAVWITVELRENQLRNVDAGDAVDILFDARPGEIYSGRVVSLAWGISIGEKTQNGLLVNQVDNRWFEPARRIPVRIELEGGLENWPRNVKVGGQVHAVIYAQGKNNPLSWLAMLWQRVRSITSYLH